MDVVESVERYRKEAFDFEEFKTLIGGQVPRELAMGKKNDVDTAIIITEEALVIQPENGEPTLITEKVLLGSIGLKRFSFYRNRIDRKFGFVCEMAGHPLNESRAVSVKKVGVEWT